MKNCHVGLIILHLSNHVFDWGCHSHILPRCSAKAVGPMALFIGRADFCNRLTNIREVHRDEEEEAGQNTCDRKIQKAGSTFRDKFHRTWRGALSFSSSPMVKYSTNHNSFSQSKIYFELQIILDRDYVI